MTWADKKIKEYVLGKKPSKMEKLVLDHANPVNLITHLLAFVALFYGLWVNNLLYVAVAFGLGLLGHLYCWLKK